MTETNESSTPSTTGPANGAVNRPANESSSAATAKKRTGGLGGMLLADLKAMAGGLGVAGAASMKKAQLVEAIKAAQSQPASRKQSRSTSQAPSADQPGDGAGAGSSDRPARGRSRNQSRAGSAPAADQGNQGDKNQSDQAPGAAARSQGGGAGHDGQPTSRRDVQDGRQDDVQDTDKRGAPARVDRDGQHDRADSDRSAGDQSGRNPSGRDQSGRDQSGKDQPGRDESGRDESGRDQSGRDQSGRDQSGRDQGNKNQGGKDGGSADQPGQAGQTGPVGRQGGEESDGDADGDGDAGSRRNRRRRGRDRTRTGTPAGGTGTPVPTAGGGGGRNEPDTTILDDDVLVPAAGILDVLDNYAFVRTSGYLPGVDDVYLSLSMVRKFGLRRGDAVVGQVRQPREGERKEKFNPMVRIDSVNGADPDTARTRPEFAAMTPVHPDQRLRLETGPGDLVGRLLDLATPIGKGQRALVESPPHAGKTTLLRAVAAAVTQNHPDCHLMVVLVDERPEEVTDFQRSVKGEVVASTFDRPPADHTVVAELAIERAKRLVELGHDVVVLLDGLTRLGRAYNMAAPAGGRVLTGGVDAGALLPPKQFFGAARNLEDGGSLTIIATATAGGSALDEVILDQLGDTANAEVRLRGDLAEAGVFPAVDLVRSSTRAVDRLISDQEHDILDKLRRVLAGMDPRTAADLLLERVRASQTNVELLTRVQRAAPGVV